MTANKRLEKESVPERYRLDRTEPFLGHGLGRV